MNHYVYEISYVTNKKYIGCRSCKCLPEEDTKYLGSSKYTPKEGIKIKTILKTFASRKEAIAYEIYLHNLYDVHINEDYYNQAKQTAVAFDTCGLKATTCEWIADKAKRRVKSHLQFIKSVYLRHNVWIEYLSEYIGMHNPISFKCHKCGDATTVNKASNHYTRQITCKKCAKEMADLVQKTRKGENRTERQKAADIKRALYKGANQTAVQLEGRKKAAKTATGKKCKARGKPGTASTLFKPWYYITPNGIYTEHKDMTLTQFIETGIIKGATRSHVFHATYKHNGKQLPAGFLKGYTFGFL